MARAKICYLHIGAEKTGSTSIQAFLRANRRRLTGHGYLFPRTPGEDNQPALAAYAMKAISRSNLRERGRKRRSRQMTRASAIPS